MTRPNGKQHRIVLTGGPGGGKTTAGDMFRRELGDEVVVVPETATMLFAGGFPRRHETAARRATQLAFFHTQRSSETVYAASFPGRVLLCDRGTVDGAAYWPDGPEAFFGSLGVTLENELSRYDGVLFFQSAAVGGLEVIEGGNPARVEGVGEAAEIDAQLQTLWSEHPRFLLIPHTRSFLEKIQRGLGALQLLLSELDGNAS